MKFTWHSSVTLLTLTCNSPDTHLPLTYSPVTHLQITCHSLATHMSLTWKTTCHWPDNHMSLTWKSLVTHRPLTYHWLLTHLPQYLTQIFLVCRQDMIPHSPLRHRRTIQYNTIKYGQNSRVVLCRSRNRNRRSRRRSSTLNILYTDFDVLSEKSLHLTIITWLTPLVTISNTFSRKGPDGHSVPAQQFNLDF